MPRLAHTARQAVRSPATALAGWVTALLALDVAWVLRFRASAVPEYDESGYMAMALHDLHGLQHGGLIGLLRAFVTGAPSAPLVPLATVVPYLVAGGRVGVSVTTQLAAVAGLAAATYALGRRMMPPRWAALAAGVTVSLPVVADFARVFHFAVPTAALLTAAAWALASSDRLRSRRWAVTCGVLLGCTALSRTMAVAYLPGVGVAALVMAVAPAPDRARRIRSLAALVGMAAIVAALWFLPHQNFRAVGHYLLGTGYGERSSDYGAAYSPLSADFWLKQARVVASEVQLAVAGALAAGLLAGVTTLVVTWRRAERHGPFEVGRLVRGVAGSPILVPAIVVAEGYAACTSSRNIGTAFSLPWLPSLVLLCVFAVSRLPQSTARRGLGAALAATAVFAVGVKSDLVPALARERSVHLPGFGTVTVTDGDWLARADVEGDGYQLPPPDRPLPVLHRRWLPFAGSEMGAVLAFAKDRRSEPRLMVATGDVVLSTTRFALAAELRTRTYVRVERLRPGGGEGAYEQAMRASPSDLLVTADPPPSGGDLDAAGVRTAAAAAGFVPFRTSQAPDGRAVTWWWRS